MLFHLGQVSISKEMFNISVLFSMGTVVRFCESFQGMFLDSN